MGVLFSILLPVRVHEPCDYGSIIIPVWQFWCFPWCTAFWKHQNPLGVYNSPWMSVIFSPNYMVCWSIPEKNASLWQGTEPEKPWYNVDNAALLNRMRQNFGDILGVETGFTDELCYNSTVSLDILENATLPLGLPPLGSIFPRISQEKVKFCTRITRNFADSAIISRMALLRTAILWFSSVLLVTLRGLFWGKCPWRWSV